MKKKKKSNLITPLAYSYFPLNFSNQLRISKNFRPISEGAIQQHQASWSCELGLTPKGDIQNKRSRYGPKLYRAHNIVNITKIHLRPKCEYDCQLWSSEVTKVETFHEWATEASCLFIQKVDLFLGITLPLDHQLTWEKPLKKISLFKTNYLDM